MCQIDLLKVAAMVARKAVSAALASIKAATVRLLGEHGAASAPEHMQTITIQQKVSILLVQ